VSGSINLSVSTQDYDHILFIFAFQYALYRIAECNNALIYPGIGFGAILSQARTVTDTMLLAGAHCLASLSPALGAAKSDTAESGLGEYNGESLLPDFGDAPSVNFEVAVAVAVQAVKEGSAGERWLREELKLEQDVVEKGGQELKEAVRNLAAKKVWVPVYNEYIYDENGLGEL
jgi:malate dehydrogenase (oxaloacetate-decarboxylating)